jgi:hypothetical protein
MVNHLNKSRLLFIIWAILAAFGSYFCMYAFRKPFTAGTYSGYSLMGMDYKAVLIIAQVLGYMLSKFIGIKIISELKPARRKWLIIGLILVAEAGLLLFGWVHPPYNVVFLLINGLPLGMVWGIVFSYLEGRRFTEVLAIGLSISQIVSSGCLKTIYFSVKGWLPSLSEFWLPGVIGLLFLPLFLFFVWMLSVIPAPTDNDKLLRAERLPMTGREKMLVLRELGWGIVCYVIIYTLLTTMRDFRDNFSVEIWNEIQPGWDKAVFSKTEMISGVIVLLAVGSLSAIRDNSKGYRAVQGLIAIGVLISGSSTLAFHFHWLSPFWWMLLSGLGLFLAYVPMQIAVFERIIALFRLKANAGFFVYICDSVGYLGSVSLLLYKEFYMPHISWSHTLMRVNYLLTVVCLILILIVTLFFQKKLKLS